MKPIITLLSASALLAVSSCKESKPPVKDVGTPASEKIYDLSVRMHKLPAGAESTIEMEYELKQKNTLVDEERTPHSRRYESYHQKYNNKHVAADKIDLEVVTDVFDSKVVDLVGDRPDQEEGKTGVLQGVTVQLMDANGKWEVAPDQEISNEQKGEAAELIASDWASIKVFNQFLDGAGERKVGDAWQIDLSNAEGEIFPGGMKNQKPILRFKSVKNVNGDPCAVLTYSLDLKSAMEEGPDSNPYNMTSKVKSSDAVCTLYFSLRRGGVVKAYMNVDLNIVASNDLSESDTSMKLRNHFSTKLP